MGFTLPKETIVALIAAGASVIGALISLAATFIKSREDARSQLKLDSNRALQEGRGERRRKLDEDRKKFLDLLSREIAVLQKMRDLLFRIANAPPKYLKVEEATRLMSDIAAMAFAEYENAVGVADKSKTKLIHVAKNQIYSVNNVLEVACEGKIFTSEIGERKRQDLMLARDSLGELQDSLRDERAQLLGEYFGNPRGA